MDGAAPLPKPTAATEGAARLRLVADGAGATRLAELFQHEPLRALLPEPPAGEPPHVVLLNTAGGLVGGDRLEVEIALGPGARALVVPQAAEKVYRSAGREASVANRLAVGAGGWLEWLPQETILFDGARLRRRLTLELAGDARALAGEIVVFGRLARGERFARGALFDGWEIRRDGRLAWADALELGPDPGAALAAPSGFGGATALATLVYAGPDAAATLAVARGALGDEPGAGASVVGEILLVRLLDASPLALRRRFGAAWSALRATAGGLKASLPAPWHA